MLDVEGESLNHLLTHMGHNWDVHKTHYRQVSDVIERLDIAKFLLIQDGGIVAENKRKRLHQIQLRDVDFRGKLCK